MTSKPLVSVITSFFNAEKFIGEAIESVFTQTYDNWELLLVDDGSTDGSTEIALRYAAQHPGKVRYFEHEYRQNRGISASLNLAITKAWGAYVAFLDADDVWLPQKLEKQVSILNSQSEAAMLYGSSLWWYGWTKNPEDIKLDRKWENFGVQPDTLVKPPALLTTFLRDGDTVPGVISLLVRREAIARFGGFEDKFRIHYTDQVFYAKICLQAPVFVSCGCWEKYRQHPDSVCHIIERMGQSDIARADYLNWLESYVSEQGVKDAELWDALQGALLPYRHPRLYQLSKRGERLVEQMKGRVKWVARHTMPGPARRWLRSQWRGSAYRPPVGQVRFGDLRRVEPIDRSFGSGRGRPVDRYYVENFLARQADDIRGSVLEVGDNYYTRKFGGDRVSRSDVLHVSEGNPKATIIGDLSRGDHIPSNTFDCVVLTQTLHLIYDVRAALLTLHRILKPGGVLLTTFPGISKIDDYEWKDSWFWSFTTRSARRLFAETFPEAVVEIEAYGNVLAAISFLHGLAVEELRQNELDHHDPDYEVLITVRAVKSQM